MTDQEAIDRLHELRRSIDNMDAALVHLLAERFRFTQAVGRLKAEHDVELGRCQCRFPVRADPAVPGGHLFCAKATLPGRVYCDYHRAVTAVDLHRRGASLAPAARRAA